MLPANIYQASLHSPEEEHRFATEWASRENISYLTIFRAMNCLPLSLTNQSIAICCGRVPEINLIYFALNLLCFSVFLGEAAIWSRRFCFCGPCQLLSCLAAKKGKIFQMLSFGFKMNGSINHRQVDRWWKAKSTHFLVLFGCNF